MSELLARARDEGAPVVLLLDSSGARVDEGLPALGAFRVLLRETLLTRLARLPMLAVVGRACFGGASLLACTCSRRHYLIGARLAASGPAVIEGAVGAAQFDARNQPSVDALMGSAARVEIDAERGTDRRCAGLRQQRRSRLVARCSGPSRRPGVRRRSTIRRAHACLRPGSLPPGARVRPRPCRRVWPQFFRAAASREWRRTRSARFHRRGRAEPRSSERSAGHRLAQRPAGSSRTGCLRCIGTIRTARSFWCSTRTGMPLPSPTSSCCCRLIWCTSVSRWPGCVAAGHRIVLWIPGRASGASYVTFAAPVDVVSALPSAQIEILPPAAVKQIVKATQNTPAGPAALLEAGVADGLLDERLRHYADLAAQRP